jgi:hypothetical protein
MENRLLDELSLLTSYAEKAIVEKAAVLECECPRYLVDLLQDVRKFQIYEKNCATTSPKDQEVHNWLYQSAINLDQMLSATIIQLARMEGMINDENQIVEHPLKKNSEI